MDKVERVFSLLEKAKEMEEEDEIAALQLYFEADTVLQKYMLAAGVNDVPNAYRFFFKQITDGYKRLGFKTDEAVI